ncbi:FMN-dependent dehydrogenase family protein [Aspergillus avenaceus]|uniref:Oxidase FUB9 n=1 Tax=Aspergillus avenaceus TaxID=36643 RepID=A0A5N6TQJ5_ASPAV|nr:FMN-dependent dehydrogenase family protein [Aspergillus avenaceus]
MSNRPKELDSKVLTIQDLELEARKRLTDVVGGTTHPDCSLRDNELAYSRYKLRPRVLRDVDGVDASTTIFGTKVSFPFGFAPAAAHRLAHPDGELATSRAAAKNNIPMCLSSWSSSSIEEVIAQGGQNPYAMQISFFRDVSITKRIIERAEAAGYKALFVSVDLPVLGHRLNESRNNFAFPDHMRFPVLAESLEMGLDDTGSRVFDPSLRWDKTIPWLKQNTKLEIWLKRVCAPGDVQLAIDYKLNGVIISNHGGRQLDGVPATLDTLRACSPVAKGKIPLAIDGGIRCGADVFKAIALGAKMCFVGRIPVWGLAYNGERGVDLAIKIIKEEFLRTMMFTGCKALSDISEDHLVVLEPNGRLSRL